eukprot:gnl/MRDRNA2_/MRDRNA2_34698_c0_seq1.p1 gnl/MRDRNA2_/MRDRNA2_34698_c0~~gnl/MRDRNA2_/MRDRNA2_34698_c0_seq1.p1  ORF type:complete len:650 (+),score=74.02 gnl/MRDRNA2_/MRDRNA2_34698_c0_seq1:81-1952(+)
MATWTTKADALDHELQYFATVLRLRRLPELLNRIEESLQSVAKEAQDGQYLAFAMVACQDTDSLSLEELLLGIEDNDIAFSAACMNLWDFMFASVRNVAASRVQHPSVVSRVQRAIERHANYFNESDERRVHIAWPDQIYAHIECFLEMQSVNNLSLLHLLDNRNIQLGVQNVIRIDETFRHPMLLEGLINLFMVCLSSRGQGIASIQALVWLSVLLQELLHPDGMLRNVSAGPLVSEYTSRALQCFTYSVITLTSELLRRQPDLISKCMASATVAILTSVIETSLRSSGFIQCEMENIPVWTIEMFSLLDPVLEGAIDTPASKMELKELKAVLKGFKKAGGMVLFDCERSLQSVMCSACGKVSVGAYSMQKCSGCGVVTYCCAACQKQHWPAHKRSCKGLAVVRSGPHEAPSSSAALWLSAVHGTAPHEAPSSSSALWPLVDITEKDVLVVLETSAGPIEMRIKPDWAKHGAKRFLDLVDASHFEDTRIYRAVRGVIVQFGLPAKQEWPAIPDDRPVGVRFERGMVCFAACGVSSRTHTIFICLNDLSDCLGKAPWETPIGQVTCNSFDTLDKIVESYNYGDIAECGGCGPAAQRVRLEGNIYLDKDFPDLTRIFRAYKKKR